MRFLSIYPSPGVFASRSAVVAQGDLDFRLSPTLPPQWWEGCTPSVHREVRLHDELVLSGACVQLVSVSRAVRVRLGLRWSLGLLSCFSLSLSFSLFVCLSLTLACLCLLSFHVCLSLSVCFSLSLSLSLSLSVLVCLCLCLSLSVCWVSLVSVSCLSLSLSDCVSVSPALSLFISVSLCV